MKIKARPSFEAITPTELLIMKSIWKTDPKPQSLSQIADDLEDSGLTYDCVKGLLPKLVKKGLLHTDIITRGPKHISFYYGYSSRPGASLESRLEDEVDDIANRLLDGDATAMVVKLIEQGHLDKDKIRQALR